MYYALQWAQIVCCFSGYFWHFYVSFKIFWISHSRFCLGSSEKHNSADTLFFVENCSWDIFLIEKVWCLPQKRVLSGQRNQKNDYLNFFIFQRRMVLVLNASLNVGGAVHVEAPRIREIFLMFFPLWYYYRHVFGVNNIYIKGCRTMEDLSSIAES